MGGLITWVSDNQVDNYLKVVYFGSIVNNRPKNDRKSTKCIKSLTIVITSPFH